jgi:hypothetical protein
VKGFGIPSPIAIIKVNKTINTPMTRAVHRHTFENNLGVFIIFSFGLTNNGRRLVQPVLFLEMSVSWTVIAVQHVIMSFMIPQSVPAKAAHNHFVLVAGFDLGDDNSIFAKESQFTNDDHPHNNQVEGWNQFPNPTVRKRHLLSYYYL